MFKNRLLAAIIATKHVRFHTKIVYKKLLDICVWLEDTDAKGTHRSAGPVRFGGAAGIYSVTSLDASFSMAVSRGAFRLSQSAAQREAPRTHQAN
jgi:hypothetical protein